jgi:hypothetical protein
VLLLSIVSCRVFLLALSLTGGGCFNDRGGAERDLPVLVSHYTSSSVSPRACLSSCLHRGYRYAGVQSGMECWCGHNYGKHGAASPEARCDQQCEDAFSKVLKATVTTGATTGNNPVTCGGGWANSIYWQDESAAVQPAASSSSAQLPPGALPLSAEVATLPLYQQSMHAPSDVVYVKGAAGQSCTDACAGETSQSVRCEESLFPLVHRHCALMQSMLGCVRCREEEDMLRGVYSPGGTEGRDCILSKGRYIRCNAEPRPDEPDYRRLCVCKKQTE